VVLGAGGPDQAGVFAHYLISAGTDRNLGSGRVDLHLVDRSGTLLIDQIVVH
jgi:hypothetical protein